MLEIGFDSVELQNLANFRAANGLKARDWWRLGDLFITRPVVSKTCCYGITNL
jgi:hypothetical protein